MTEDNKPKPLAGDEALDLWRQGREAWNRWIKLNPNREISFIDVDFSNQRDSEGNISFEGYNFGNGNVDFSITTFGDGDVNFANAVFGDGDVDFSHSTFGKGYLIFSGVTFSNGDVNFVAAEFDDGYVDFSYASFGDGDVNFSEVRFGAGQVNFSHANFGNGNVDFSETDFGEGGVQFDYTTFGRGEVNFFQATFGLGEFYLDHATFDDGDVDFSNVTFGRGYVDFSWTVFGNGEVNFSDADFIGSDVNFSGTKFVGLLFKPLEVDSVHIIAESLYIKSRAVFAFPASSQTIKALELSGASFDGAIFLSGDLGIIPDLRATRYAHQIDLSDLDVKLPRTWPRLGWPLKLSRIADNPKDGAKLRRLKEISENNKDHQAALRFSADENRARRWIQTTWLGSVLDMTFSAYSNYGQSILRPSFALFLLAVGSIGVYKKLAVTTGVEWWTGPGWGQSLLLSISNSLPFLPQSRDFRADALKALYPCGPSLTVDALMIGQGVLSFVFLFLIGLGLRNRFRL